MNISRINTGLPQTKLTIKQAASKAVEQASTGKSYQFVSNAMQLEGKATNFPKVLANVIAAGVVGTKDFVVNLVKNLK